MEIAIGEYVRTQDGYIAKAVERDVDNWLYFDNTIMEIDECECITLNPLEQKERVVAHSKNIIDLIKKGDYVNGEVVDLIDDERGYIFTKQRSNFYENEIKTILTKEQYRNNCYVVKE